MRRIALIGAGFIARVHAEAVTGAATTWWRLSAREYIAALAAAMHRPLKLHPQAMHLLWPQEIGKYLIKRATGRRAGPPSSRDLLSRDLTATFDCVDARRNLGRSPVADAARSCDRAILVHAG